VSIEISKKQIKEAHVATKAGLVLPASGVLVVLQGDGANALNERRLNSIANAMDRFQHVGCVS